MVLGILLICIGIAALKWRQILSDVMNASRPWPAFFGTTRPQTVVIWAVGIIIVGLAVAFGL
jgi:hypothetical protein